MPDHIRNSKSLNVVFFLMSKHSYPNKFLIVNVYSSYLVFFSFIEYLYLLMYNASEQDYLVLVLYKYTVLLLLLLCNIRLAVNSCVLNVNKLYYSIGIVPQILTKLSKK